jgi:hypothetical protein
VLTTSPGLALLVAGDDVDAVSDFDVDVELLDEGSDLGESAVDEPDAAPAAEPESAPADCADFGVDESDSVGLAHATRWPVATAAPTPGATAKPPTRPT